MKRGFFLIAGCLVLLFGCVTPATDPARQTSIGSGPGADSATAPAQSDTISGSHLANDAASTMSAPPTSAAGPVAGTSITRNAIPLLGSRSPAVQSARLLLSHHGITDPDAVSVIHIEPTTWSDDCLELPSARKCRAEATPGYTIELEKDGQRYLVHTDQSGSQVRLARSPFSTIPDAFLHWQYVDGMSCQMAQIGILEMRYSICGEALLDAPSNQPGDPTVKEQSQASNLRQKYAPFTAKTVRGTLVFSGTGTTIASAAEQRMIAEWAAVQWQRASVSYVSADFGLRLFWHEDTPSLCGGLWILGTGLAIPWNCKESGTAGTSFLPAMQLAQFYQWLDSGVRWKIERRGQEAGRVTSINLYFPLGDLSGPKPTPEEEQAVLQFARQVFAELAPASWR